MDKAALLALADRVEALEGPDRHVDADIAALVRTALPKGCEWAFNFPKWEGEHGGLVRIIGNINGNGEHIAGRFKAPPFTGSIDAAFSLLPEDNYYQFNNESGYHVAKVLDVLPPRKAIARAGRGNTLPLAITAAALRARAEGCE